MICAYSCIFRISHLEMFQIHHFRRRAQGGLDGSDWFVILISISAGWFIESRCGYKLQYFFVYSYSPDSSFMNWEIVNTNSYVLWSSYSWLAEKYILPILRLSFQIFPWFMDNRGKPSRRMKNEETPWNIWTEHGLHILILRMMLVRGNVSSISLVHGFLFRIPFINTAMNLVI